MAEYQYGGYLIFISPHVLLVKMLKYDKIHILWTGNSSRQKYNKIQRLLSRWMISTRMYYRYCMQTELLCTPNLGKLF